jgi:predicted permease
LNLDFRLLIDCSLRLEIRNLKTKSKIKNRKPMTTLLQDIRFALRILSKSRGFTAVVVLTLALGIGANAAIFSLTDTVLLQSLPVEKPEDLVVFSSYEKEKPERDSSFSYQMYRDLRDRNDVFSGVIARGGTQMNVSYGDQNDRVHGELVSGNFFETLGVRAWVGRLLTQNDDTTPGAHQVAVLSYSFWESRFNKDPQLIGKTILINEYPMTVIGVTPPSFYGLSLDNNADVRVPLMMTPVFDPQPPNRLTSRRHQWLSVVARLKDGVSAAQGQASLAVLYHQVREEEAQQLPGSVSAFDRERFLARKIALLPGAQGLQYLQDEMRTSLWLIFGATCVVLLILCANLANLMLARTTVRSREIAVRLALGAARLRLLRQWLTEGLVLSLIGGAAGIFVAMWIKAGLLAFIPADVRKNLEGSFTWRLYGFILLISIVVGIAFSLAPALKAARQLVNPSFSGDSRSVTSAERLVSLRSGLILLQVSLSLPLLLTAALLVRTLQNLRAIDTGFEKANVLFATVNPALNGYPPEKSHTFFEQLLTRARALPGVTTASLASDTPISGGWDQNGIVVEGYTPREGELMDSDVTVISPDYFKSLGIAFLLGRDFSDQDRQGTPKVTIVNEKLARHFFGTTNVIGKRIGVDAVPDITIVGVVRDVKYVNLRENLRRHFYLPVAQEKRLTNLTLHVKTAAAPEPLADSVRAEVNALDPHLPLYNVMTLAKEIDESLNKERLVTWLTSAFGVLATLLTALGLYGVLTFSVARRTREIGIRVALGAQRRDVMQLVLVQGLILVTAGVALGLLAAFGVSRVIASLLFGIYPTNAATLIAVTVGLFVVGLFACYLPARRATKVDPSVALRYE